PFPRWSYLAPNLAEPHLLLAEVALRSQAPDQAIAAAEKVLKVQAENGIAYRLLGQAFMAKGETAKALVVLKTATEKAPQDARSYFYLGTAYQKQQQNQEACDTFAKALALEPNLNEARAQQIVLCTGKDQGAKVAEDL